MAYATYDDIKTVLDALTYATGKPAWHDGIEGVNVKVVPACVINWGAVEFREATTGASPLDEVINSFQLCIFNKDWSDCDAVLTVMRAGIAAKSISGGHWHVDSATRMKYGGFFVIVATAHEQIFGV